MVVGARQADLSISKTAGIYCLRFQFLADRSGTQCDLLLLTPILLMVQCVWRALGNAFLFTTVVKLIIWQCFVFWTILCKLGPVMRINPRISAFSAAATSWDHIFLYILIIWELFSYLISAWNVFCCCWLHYFHKYI